MQNIKKRFAAFITALLVIFGGLAFAPVEVGAEPVTFEITVTSEGGDAEGYSADPEEAEPGDTITLNAGTNPGYVFVNWTSEQEIEFDDETDPETTFEMIAEDVTVTANWEVEEVTPPPPTFRLSIENTGTGGTPIGQTWHPSGTNILLNAGTRTGYTFSGWTVSPTGTISFSNASLAQTNFTMTNQHIIVRAHWTPIAVTPVFLTLQNTGTGGTPSTITQRTAGAIIPLNAGTRIGYSFNGWTTDTGTGVFVDATSVQTDFTMPNQSVIVTANWIRIGGTFTVIIENNPTGTVSGQLGQGHYLPGTVVNISAGTRANYTFSGWTVSSGGPSLANSNAANTSFTMPSSSILLTANWISTHPSPTPSPGTFTLTLRSTSGGRVAINSGDYGTTRTGHFRPGDRITISARADRDYYFDIWDAPRANINDEFRNRTTFTMPNRNITVWAEFVYYRDWDGGNWRPRPGVTPPPPQQAPFPPAVAPGGPQLPRPTQVPAPPPPQQTPWLNHDYVPQQNVQQNVQQPQQPLPPPEPAPVPVTPEVIRLSVNVNGRPLNLTGQPAVLVQGSSLIPTGDVFRALGYTVSWDGNTRTATLTRHGVTIALQEGNDSFTVNGIRHSLPVAPVIVNGNLMVPVVNVVNAIGGRAHRDINDTIHIYLTR